MHSGLAGSWLTVEVQNWVAGVYVALFQLPDVFSPIKVLVVSRGGSRCNACCLLAADPAASCCEPTGFSRRFPGHEDYCGLF